MTAVHCCLEYNRLHLALSKSRRSLATIISSVHTTCPQTQGGKIVFHTFHYFKCSLYTEISYKAKHSFVFKHLFFPRMHSIAALLVRYSCSLGVEAGDNGGNRLGPSPAKDASTTLNLQMVRQMVSTDSTQWILG